MGVYETGKPVSPSRLLFSWHLHVLFLLVLRFELAIFMVPFLAKSVLDPTSRDGWTFWSGYYSIWTLSLLYTWVFSCYQCPTELLSPSNHLKPRVSLSRWCRCCWVPGFGCPSSCSGRSSGVMERSCRCRLLDPTCQDTIRGVYW